MSSTPATLLALFTLLALLCLINDAQATKPDPCKGHSPKQFCDPLVVPLSDKVNGLKYSKWAAEWWKYILSLPMSSNPAFDDTGDFCNVAQEGPVFFLAGSFLSSEVTRDCTIEGSKYLFFPLINVECSNVESPQFFGATPGERRACAITNIHLVDPSSLKASVDDEPVKHPERYLIQSPDFDFTMPPEDNVLRLDGVTHGSAVSAGYFLMLRPLSPGPHTIHWEAAVTDDESEFTLSITYHLTVTS